MKGQLSEAPVAYVSEKGILHIVQHLPLEELFTKFNDGFGNIMVKLRTQHLVAGTVPILVKTKFSPQSLIFLYRSFFSLRWLVL